VVLLLRGEGPLEQSIRTSLTGRTLLHAYQDCVPSVLRFAARHIIEASKSSGVAKLHAHL